MGAPDPPTTIINLDGADTEVIHSDAVLAALAASEQRQRKQRTQRRPVSWNAGLDLGLVLLRLTVGGACVAHGLRTVFGLMAGQGVGGFSVGLSDLGYRETTVLAWTAGVTELVGGGLLLVGFMTPLAAGAVLALVVNTVLVKYAGGYFVQPANAPGVEPDVLLGGMALALLFAGPGRVSLDRWMPWFRRPLLVGWIFLVLGGCAAVLVYLVFRR